jgi:hypothetical protein
MNQGQNIDGVLLQWGDRLFYPGNRIVHTRRNPSSARSPQGSGPPPSASASRRPWCAGRLR